MIADDVSSRAKTLRNEGYLLKQIAAELGISVSSAWKMTREVAPMQKPVAQHIVICAVRTAARNRGRKCDLSDDEILQLSRGNCLYCGIRPMRIIGYDHNPDVSKERKNEVRRVTNGIDRVFNDLGYHSSNCVTCCHVCNRGKGPRQLFWWISYLTEVRPDRINLIKSELTRVCGPDWEQRMMDEFAKQKGNGEQND